MLIDRYKKGEVNAVALLHQLAQTLLFHLEIKETVTTGKAPQHVGAFTFTFRDCCYWSMKACPLITLDNICKRLICCLWSKL